MRLLETVRWRDGFVASLRSLPVAHQVPAISTCVGVGFRTKCSRRRARRGVARERNEHQMSARRSARRGPYQLWNQRENSCDHRRRPTQGVTYGGRAQRPRRRTRTRRVRATRAQTQRLLAWAEPFESRTWAIEGADGLGYLLSQQLLAAGERVLDVPATLAARTRVLGSGQSNKTDANDARSVAITALRNRALREVRLVGHGEVLRLLAKRNTDIGDQRCRVVSRMHSLLMELAPGGISKEINASDVDTFLTRVSPRTPAEQVRYDLAIELLADI